MPFNLLGQTISLDIEKVGDSLKTSGIDTFVIYKYYCNGRMPQLIKLDKNASENEINKALCEIADSIYLLYIHNGHSYIQKRNECYIFNDISIDTTKIMTFFVNNFDKILNEEILDFSYVNRKGQRESIMEVHSCHSEMYISQGKIRKIVNVDWFNLSKNSKSYGLTNGYKNVSYYHNIKTNTWKLISLIAHEVDKQSFIKY